MNEILLNAQRARFGQSSVADVMTKKYVDGLPLARQEKIWARPGCGVEPCHAGQLGDPVYPNLAEATVPAYETGLAGRHRNSRG